MPHSDLNQHSDFDRLNIPKLKTIAKRWASEYPEGFIQKILLYSYLSPYNRVFKKTLNSTVPIKYAIVFDISTVWIRLIVEQTQAHYQSDFSGCELCEILGPNVYDKLVDATEKYYTVHEGYPALMSADFENVYKENAKEDFWKEWSFKIKGPDDSLPIAVKTEEPLIVLYELDDTRTKIERLINDARTEIELVYNEIKSVGFSGKLIDEQKIWRKAALAIFDKSNFKYIRKDYLTDKSLYGFSEGHEKRDFIGAILQRIIADKGFGQKGYQELYRIYIKTA
jgi:hypothetical protein